MSRYINAMLVVLFIVSGVLVFLPSGYVGAWGIVVNTGFEDGEERVPASWNVTGNAMHINTGPVCAGNWSAQVTAEGDVLTQWLSVGNITLPITYNVWGWIYVSGNVTGVISFDFWTAVNGTQSSPTEIFSTTDTNGAYVEKASTIVAPICTTCLRIRLLGTGWNDGAEVRFDDIGFWPVSGYCFIATAAYGTETASQLDILRDFRDQVLLKNALGSRFVETYYKVSPPIADFIAKNDFLRAIVREVLVDPVVKLLQWSQDLWGV